MSLIQTANLFSFQAVKNTDKIIFLVVSRMAAKS